VRWSWYSLSEESGERNMGVQWEGGCDQRSGMRHAKSEAAVIV
jgi:hypothetical protein